MSFAHPRTMRLEDAGLPAVSALLGIAHPPPLQAAVGIAGGEVMGARVSHVSWWPGKSITVRYKVDVSGGSLDGTHAFVCAVGRIPDGAVLVEAEGQQVGVWRVPHDPALPGMASALDHERVSSLLAELGSSNGPVTTRLRAYRPRRRAVVEAKGIDHDIFLKVLRPDRVKRLHRIHRELARSLPIPASLGVDIDQGIVALQALPGVTLRQALDDPEQKIPPVEQLVAVLDTLPAPRSNRASISPIERMPETIDMLATITPELTGKLEFLRTAIGDETQPADRPVHGDYYESQLMVTGGNASGLLDVDTFGWGRPADDPATMLGHLSAWADMSARPERVRELGQGLLGAWDTVVDPTDLRIRTAAVVVSLASGPFRVQSAAWPSEVAQRLEIAEEWVRGALEK